jgi:hypothetical protein
VRGVSEVPPKIILQGMESDEISSILSVSCYVIGLMTNEPTLILGSLKSLITSLERVLVFGLNLLGEVTIIDSLLIPPFLISIVVSCYIFSGFLSIFLLKFSKLTSSNFGA